MPIAIWTPNLETGNPTVDAQHKTLFAMVNDLHHGIIQGQGRETMGPILKKLAKYAVDHFGTEEGFMKQTGYPNRLRHKGKHDALTAQVVDLLKAWDAGEALPSTLSKFLAEWVSHHIKEEDMELVAWIKETR
jgi:hemerythrin-like metal-binding protein